VRGYNPRVASLVVQGCCTALPAVSWLLTQPWQAVVARQQCWQHFAVIKTDFFISMVYSSQI